MDIRTLIDEEIPQIVDPETDLDDGYPQYQIVINKDRAASYGLDISDIASAVDAMLDGSTPTSYWDDGVELDIIVQLGDEDRTSLLDLDALFVVTSSGDQIPLSNIVSYEWSQGPLDISREDETRTIHVEADLVSGVTATEIMPIVQNLVESEIVLPEGVTLSFEGDTQSINEMKGPLLTVAVVAILLIFAVMASQFESLVDPFIIFFSIPLLLIGVMGVYQLTGETFSLFSIIGMVVLAGIVVNNGIVLVDYTNLLRKRGATVLDAVLEASPSRLRPVLMTSLTTILGMVPLGFFPGDGTEMIRPIGQTIVGGLAGATVITLFVTPIVYTLVNHDSKRIRRRRKGDETEALEQEVAV